MGVDGRAAHLLMLRAPFLDELERVPEVRLRGLHVRCARRPPRSRRGRRRRRSSGGGGGGRRVKVGGQVPERERDEDIDAAPLVAAPLRR